MQSLVSLLKYLATLPEEKPEGLWRILLMHLFDDKYIMANRGKVLFSKLYALFQTFAQVTTENVTQTLLVSCLMLIFIPEKSCVNSSYVALIWCSAFLGIRIYWARWRVWIFLLNLFEFVGKIKSFQYQNLRSKPSFLGLGLYQKDLCLTFCKDLALTY